MATSVIDTLSPLPTVNNPPPKSLATFRRAIPSFSVTHVPTALPWYKEVLGFAVVGNADTGRAELHRAEPGARKGEGGVSLYLRKVAADEPVPKGSLWIEVDSVDSEWATVMRARLNRRSPSTTPILRLVC